MVLLLLFVTRLLLVLIDMRLFGRSPFVLAGTANQARWARRSRPVIPAVRWI
jgi:hypothetical protein